KEESIEAILEMAQLKRENGKQRLIVTGCLGERYRDQLKTEIPEIDVVLGTGDVPDIVRAIGGARSAGPVAAPVSLFRSRREVAGGAPDEPAVDLHTPAEAPTYLYDASTPRLLTTPRHFAYVKVAEG